MNWINLIVFWLGTAITIFIQLKTYEKLSEYKQFKWSYKYFLLILASAVLITYVSNTTALAGVPRAYISFVLMLILEMIIYNDGIKKTIAYGSFCYILVVASEIILSILALATKFINLNSIDKSALGKFLLSIIMIIPPYLIAGINKIKRVANFVFSALKKSLVWIICVILFLIASLIIAYKNAMFLSFDKYFGNILLLIIFFSLIIIILFKEYRINKEINNAKVLLDFISQYEKKIDEDRINRHEMLNNLLILKSYDNKNSKRYNHTLDSFIELYSKSNFKMKNIHLLPSGLKGILYYKINGIKNKNVSVNINISKKLSSALEKIDNKTYVIVCKIIGITFDNAVEAVVKSDNKIIDFEVYEYKDNIIIEVTNGIGEAVDIDKIRNKNYTTKENGRGLGLYIAEKLIRNNSNINLKQFIDGNLFVSQLSIKKSR